MKVKSYQLWAALLVEVYQALVNRHPQLLRVPYLSALVDALMDHWIEWRIERTMQDVDAQVSEILQQESQEQPGPFYSETLKGETLLGGEMRLQSQENQVRD